MQQVKDRLTSTACSLISSHLLRIYLLCLSPLLCCSISSTAQLGRAHHSVLGEEWWLVPAEQPSLNKKVVEDSPKKSGSSLFQKLSEYGDNIYGVMAVLLCPQSRFDQPFKKNEYISNLQKRPQNSFFLVHRYLISAVLPHKAFESKISVIIIIITIFDTCNLVDSDCYKYQQLKIFSNILEPC